MSATTLKSIKEKHAAWSDPLSLRLKRWAEKTTDSNLKAQVAKLYEKILVNPLNESFRLQEPVLASGRVWEKQCLDHYKAETELSISPFDGKPLGEAQPHSFARAVLDWSAPLMGGESRALEKVESKEMAPSSSATDKARQKTVYAMYWYLAQKAEQRQIVRSLSREMTQLAKSLETRAALSRAHAEELQEQNNKGMRSFSESCTSSASVVQKTQDETVGIHQKIEEEIARGLKKVQELEAALKKSMEVETARAESLKRERAQLG